ncbi:MAG: 3-dehydroquinate synthase [Clostridia bacterium]|nr:3-dehydroquinate synthase [Clostridia bacterium]
MKTVHIDASAAYDVLIGDGLLNELGTRAASLPGVRKVLLVSDDTVFALYGERAAESLRKAGLDVATFVFPHGEAFKNLEVYGELLEAALAAGMTRTDAFAALGGGVVGDLTGFAAATFKRGIRFIQLPTTLLSAVDASVGGKTAVDLPGGKNQVGAFHQPALVLCDTHTLATLPEAQFLSGCGEVIKYAMLAGGELFETLCSFDGADGIAAHLEDVIRRCVELKRDYVQADEFDTGVRMLLNLGHTFGHGAEALSGYKLPHGCAVAAGMAVITRAAAARGYCEPETLRRLLTLLERFGLPASIPYSAEELLPVIRGDKKAAGGNIRLIVPEAPGRVRALTVAIPDLAGWLRDGGVL